MMANEEYHLELKTEPGEKCYGRSGDNTVYRQC